jgi:ABC-type nitrate/sulfonate/bicarbonate transport system substrate-binding protein
MVRYLAITHTLIWLVILSSGDSRGAERERDQLHTIRIAYVSPVTTMAPIWIASEIGAYQREGLDARIVFIDARIAVAALVAGEVDAVVISAPSVIPPVLSGANIAFIAGLHNKMIFSFHAQPDIQSSAHFGERLSAQIGTAHPQTTETEWR